MKNLRKPSDRMRSSADEDMEQFADRKVEIKAQTTMALFGGPAPVLSQQEEIEDWIARVYYHKQLIQ